MSELIDRQATINAIHCNIVVTGRENAELVAKTMGEFVDRIKALPTIQPEVLACGNGELVTKPEPQWIPVERELPEDYTDVLVWFEYFRYGDYNCLYQMHGIGNYSKEYNSWTINHETGWKDLHVFAWMPLPTPYTK